MHFNLLLYIFLNLPFAQADIAYSSQTSSVLSSSTDSISQWKGYTRYHLQVGGRDAFITAPNQAVKEKHWVWRARFPEWHTDMDEILLEAGFHIAYINTDNMFGSPGAMEIWDIFYEYLVREWSFEPKVTLEGVSRGGLFVYNWAKRHPWKVYSIYTEAPVCDFNSWPGGKGTGKGDRQAWEILKNEYGFASDEEALAYKDNPVDNLEALAMAKIPILSMIGLEDQVVPPTENTFVLNDRYVKLGGISTIVPCTRAKQELMGHHFPIETPQYAADFIRSNIDRSQLPLNPSTYHQPGRGLRNSQIRFERDKMGTVAFLGGSITQNGGWRDSICTYLQQSFPDTRFTFISAGIASMGSTPGAFRLVRDVLSKGPVDLLFEEAAVNDATNGRSVTEQIRGMEGIIRHTLAANPATDIVLMHFVDPEKILTYNQGQIPEVIRNFDLVAGHYHVGSINLAKEVTHRIANGEFTWEGDFKDVHPSPFGQSIYFQSMKAYLEKAYSQPLIGDEEISEHGIPKALDAYSYDNGSIIPFHKASDVQGFEHIISWSPDLRAGTREGYTDVDMLVGLHPGNSFTFHFEGKAVGIMVAAGPDAGVLEYSIDGQEAKKVDLFTRWSLQLYLPWYYTLAAELDQCPHTLEVRISQEKNANSVGHSCILKAFYINK